MKKVIIAITVVLTAGLLTSLARNNNVKTERIVKPAMVYDKSISLGTAD
ncbi:MAG: hypothetical protein ACXVAY_13940 [Mucilaginibacter sp.]